MLFSLYFDLFVFLVISRFFFFVVQLCLFFREGGDGLIWVLVASVPDLCIRCTFINKKSFATSLFKVETM